jgi:hypothetical protein
MGFIKSTRRLKIAVAVNVAATETTAVVPAVTNISLVGSGTSTSVPGRVICLISGGLIVGLIYL